MCHFERIRVTTFIYKCIQCARLSIWLGYQGLFTPDEKLVNTVSKKQASADLHSNIRTLSSDFYANQNWEFYVLKLLKLSNCTRFLYSIF